MAKVEEDVYARAAATGWYTPEELDRMRRNNIRPPTKRWVPLGPPVKKRPAWLASLIRLFAGPGE